MPWPETTHLRHFGHKPPALVSIVRGRRAKPEARQRQSPGDSRYRNFGGHTAMVGNGLFTTFWSRSAYPRRRSADPYETEACSVYEPSSRNSIWTSLLIRQARVYSSRIDKAASYSSLPPETRCRRFL